MADDTSPREIARTLREHLEACGSSYERMEGELSGLKNRMAVLEVAMRGVQRSLTRATLSGALAFLGSVLVAAAILIAGAD